MKDEIERWVNWLETARRSPATIAGYRWDVQHLAGWGEGQGLTRPEAWTFDDLTRYMAERRRAGLGDSAAKRAVASFKSFFGFALGEASPAARLPYPRVAVEEQRTLNFEQLLAVLASCDTSTTIGQRDLAMLCLMGETGIRALEVCRLRVDQVDLSRRRLSMLQKGQKLRRGVFTAHTAGFLLQWLTVRDGLAAPGVETVFVSIGGLTPGRPLTPDGLRAIFSKIGAAAGIGAFSPHDMRRTFATLSTELGAPTRKVQIGGGWGSVKLVERYTQALGLDGLEQYSPIVAVLRGQTLDS